MRQQSTAVAEPRPSFVPVSMIVIKLLFMLSLRSCDQAPTPSPTQAPPQPPLQQPETNYLTCNGGYCLDDQGQRLLAE